MSGTHEKRGLSDCWPQPLRDALDPFGMYAACVQVQQAWLKQPQALGEQLLALGSGLVALQAEASCRLAGGDGCDLVPVVHYDERFKDPSWDDNPLFDHLKEVYLLYTHWLEDAIYATPDLAEPIKAKAGYQVRQLLNALSPSNFFWSNPEALQRCLKTGGGSLRDGVRNLINDTQQGTIRMADDGAFRVGDNLATSPGTVVFRNELLELIQYAPTTEQVHQVPILFVAPWINKYYIVDLTADKSLVNYLTGQGFTLFVTSWKNPGPELSGVTLEDYLFKGVLQAVGVARSICAGAPVHLAGYCIGGTSVAALMAWLNSGPPEDNPVAHWSLFTTLVDFSAPGEIGVFIDEAGVAFLERHMADSGFLAGQDMANTFRALRSNGLIWHQFVHNYLLGLDPPAFDILYWNTDVTRMPAAMHAFYLRELYLNNRLAQADSLTLGGRSLALHRISQPLYAVGAEQDHITPWRETFKTTALVSGPVRYVLATSGHIQGVVNPPLDPPKRRYWVGEVAADQSADSWRDGVAKVPGSWWLDWVAWLGPQCGPMQAPPAIGNADYPAIMAAPGCYVLER